MPLFASTPRALPPTNAVRATLIASLHPRHRPELSDLLASADLMLDGTGLWVGVAGALDSAWLAGELFRAAVEAGLSPLWLEEQLWAAAVESGLPFSWIHVVASSGDAWPGAAWPGAAV